MELLPVLCAVCLMAYSSLNNGGKRTLMVDESVATSGSGHVYYGGGGGGFFVIIICFGCCYYGKRRSVAVAGEDTRQLDQHEQPPATSDVQINMHGEPPSYTGGTQAAGENMGCPQYTREYVNTYPDTFLRIVPSSDVKYPGREAVPRDHTETFGENTKRCQAEPPMTSPDCTPNDAGAPSGEYSMTETVHSAYLSQCTTAYVGATQDLPTDPPPPYDARYI